MRFVSLQMRVSVARNDILGLKWRYCGPKNDILDYWGILIFLFVILLYPAKGKTIIGLKQCIWEDPTGKMMSVGRF